MIIDFKGQSIYKASITLSKGDIIYNARLIECDIDDNGEFVVDPIRVSDLLGNLDDVDSAVSECFYWLIANGVFPENSRVTSYSTKTDHFLSIFTQPDDFLSKDERYEFFHNLSLSEQSSERKSLDRCQSICRTIGRVFLMQVIRPRVRYHRRPPCPQTSQQIPPRNRQPSPSQ